MSDDLERRVRDLLRSRNLSVDPAPDALERVHAGAQRRHRRRMASSAAAAAVVVLAGAAAAGVAFRPGFGGPGHTVAASADSSASTTATSKSPAPPSPSPSREVSLKPSSLISPPVAPPNGGAGSRFDPVSVSAVSVATFWVLGYPTTATSDGTTTKAELLRTTDGGGSFTRVGQPPFLLGQETISRPAGVASTVGDVRFANATDGWAFGPALYQTSDGAATWKRVTEIPGAVVDLVAANNVAWAVVDLSFNPASGPAPPESTPHFALYSTPYGNGSQHWTRVSLPIDLGSVTPSIVDQDGTVTLLASGPLRKGDRDHVLIAPPGKPFTDHVGPCSQELGGHLSNSTGAVWAVCPTGHMAGLSFSTDRGATWRAQTGLANFPDPGSAIGAIDDEHAIVMDYASGSLLRLGRTGPGQPLDAPSADVAGAVFIGFTKPSTGFAILAHHDASTANDLLRTTDGGLHWSVVRLPAT